MIDFKTDFAVYSWIGSIVTAILSATFTIAFQTYKENKIQKEQQRAFAILFEAILNDCIILLYKTLRCRNGIIAFGEKIKCVLLKFFPKKLPSLCFC